MSELGESPLIAGDRHLSVDEARAAIRQALQPVDGVESVPVTQALGRVLAAEVVSPIDVPAHDNSAMDGYAFDGAALRADAALELQAVGTVHAGTPWPGVVGAGQCLRIMTGAVMPARAMSWASTALRAANPICIASIIEPSSCACIGPHICE